MNFFSPNLYSLNFYGCNLLLCWPKTVQKISFNWHQVFVHFTWVSSFVLKPGCSMILKICPFFCLSICLPNFHICCLFPYLSLCLSLPCTICHKLRPFEQPLFILLYVNKLRTIFSFWYAHQYTNNADVFQF